MDDVTKLTSVLTDAQKERVVDAFMILMCGRSLQDIKASSGLAPAVCVDIYYLYQDILNTKMRANKK
jgi:hypothetical protein